jgi:integrase
VLLPWLRADPEAFLFSPAEAMDALSARRRAARRSPLTPSQAARRPKADPRNAPKDRYTTAAYRRAIARACEQAAVPAWHPHQLRHSVATRVRAAFGLESAQHVLGHAKASTTEIYAEASLAKAVEAMQAVG